MTPNGRSPRESPGASVVVRQRLADNLPLVVAVLLVLAVIGGWVAYASHVSPPTEQTQRTVGSVETAGEFEHGAVVRSENPVYPADTVLQDRRHYFRSVSPILNGTFAHDYAANGTDVTVRTSVSLQIRSADSEGVYWSVTEPLAERQVEGADDDGTVVVPFEVDVVEATDRIVETDARLGGSPGDPEIEIGTETVVSATVNGDRVTTAATHELPIFPSGSTYTVGPAEVDTASEQVTATVAVPREYGPIATYGSVMLFLVATGLLALLVGLRTTGSLRPSERDRDAVSTARERKSLDEWITTGRIPPAYRDRPTVSVRSLSGLVDVAIDSDRRVIEDEDRGGFYVVDGDVVYAFEPDRESGDSSQTDVLPHVSDRASDEFEWTEKTGDEPET